MTRTEGDPASELRRPRDLALLLLAAGDESPRQRARDQQADMAGLALRRKILDRLAALDPESDRAALVDALDTIVQELGGPTGPSRAVALSLLDEWDQTQAQPTLWEWLLSRAIEASER